MKILIKRPATSNDLSKPSDTCNVRVLQAYLVFSSFQILTVNPNFLHKKHKLALTSCNQHRNKVEGRHRELKLSQNKLPGVRTIISFEKLK